MRIGVLLDPYGEGSPGGLGRFVHELTKALLEQSPENEFILYTKGDTQVSFEGTNWQARALHTKRIWLSAGRALDEGLDCYIFFTPVIPLFFHPKHSVVFAHDFAYMELSDRTFRQTVLAFFLKSLHRHSFRKATKIVAITEATKDVIVKHFGISPHKITVIYNGYVVSTVEPEPLPVPEHYVLFAGVLKERKNVLGIIRAFALFSKHYPNHKLLIAGKKEGEYYEVLKKTIQELGITESVVFLGYVSDAHLAYLYRHAESFVFPSFIEGFGMPVLEAMYAGLPVITSNTGALAEVSGDAALLVDPNNPDDIARAMQRLAEDTRLRDEYIQRGHTRVKEFSWHETARHLLEVITEVRDKT